ncbi:hypothetical protein [Brevibacillus brevis]|uniref:hypothetical protein n=1 Tax=Brevibacillus brevis TaxID=1393 RepID=UPI000D0FFE0C|nr:hypothetical protein [Brevibacillus brevis]PSJ63545.1 hypothetical protein C7J99_31295 [Brevibacillus brevis]RED33848.1 hypothetical protein DES34_10213 [Brevibacillus brevis]GEC93339.1 hypothetical protein BBR01nite_56700 [Brevibacillus brevis]VEF92582.1 Uncharacterised protein [Brevibacillus brevis]
MAWFSVLNEKLKEIGVDLTDHEFGEGEESSFWIAQKLVGNPFTSALKKLEDLASGGNDHEN